MNNCIIFNGKGFAGEKERELLGKLARLRQGFGLRLDEVDLRPDEVGEAKGKSPKLVAILIGDNPESELYLRLKEKVAKRLGIEFEFQKFSGDSSQEIIDFIEKKNNDESVNGIMIELPLPKEMGPMGHIRLISQIKPEKDVDCLTSENLQLLEEGKPKFVPPTVKAVGEILNFQFSIFNFQNKINKTVVVGSEGTVGKGIISYLRTIGEIGDIEEIRGVDKETKDLEAVTKEADVLISATGIGHLITKGMVKPGAIIIDVGIEKQADGRLIGDVDFENVKEIASFITPVPGGVGPVTIICLMENLVESLYH